MLIEKCNNFVETRPNQAQLTEKRQLKTTNQGKTSKNPWPTLENCNSPTNGIKIITTRGASKEMHLDQKKGGKNVQKVVINVHGQYQFNEKQNEKLEIVKKLKKDQQNRQRESAAKLKILYSV